MVSLLTTFLEKKISDVNELIPEPNHLGSFDSSDLIRISKLKYPYLYFNSILLNSL